MAAVGVTLTVPDPVPSTAVSRWPGVDAVPWTPPTPVGSVRVAATLGDVGVADVLQPATVPIKAANDANNTIRFMTTSFDDGRRLARPVRLTSTRDRSVSQPAAAAPSTRSEHFMNNG